MIWLGGALAAGVVVLAAYLLSGSAIDKAFAQDIAYFRIGAGTPGIDALRSRRPDRGADQQSARLPPVRQ